MMTPVQKVYISHAPADLEVALQLAKHLAQDGFQTSGNHLVAGRSAGNKTSFYESVAEVRGFVILLTADSLVDEHVKRETNIAIENKIPIYPVNLTGEDELKKLLSSEWRYWLSITQILTCSTAREASTKLRFRLSAGAALKMEEDLSIRESIVGSWRALESLLEQIGIAKMSHTSIEFQDLHNQFDNEVVPGFTEISKHLKSPEQNYQAENKFAGKMIFGLFNILQYFDCHALTIDRDNSCGLRGHEIETLIERYIKFAAISFEYPSAITWYIETQFLWNYQNFLESCPPLLKYENFSTYSQILTLDYRSLYSTPIDYGPEFKKWDHKPELSLKAHIFDDLSKYVFYNNVAVLASENVSVSELNSALISVNTFFDQSEIDPVELELMAECREEFQMSGYPTLSLFKAYLLRLLGKEDQVKISIEEFNIIDVSLLKHFLTKGLSASNGNGKHTLEKLWDFFQENYEIESSENGHSEENAYYSEKRSFSVAKELYSLGNRFFELGDIDTALDLWARSARGGIFSGLTSYTWATLQTGAFDAGVALFEDCSEIPCDPLSISEKFNSKGNYLLNHLARDNDYASAIKSFNSLILEEGTDTTFINHISLITLEFQFGDRGRAVQLFEAIPKDVISELKLAYEEEATNAEGWLLGWCLQVVVVISEISRD